VPQTGLARIVDEVQRVLRLGSCSAQLNRELMEFVAKLSEILFVYQITDPPIKCAVELIGQQIEFNALHHDAIDGFIRPGDRCVIVLPPVVKASGEVMTRAGVLHVDYEISG
jgi:hypothetical protein